jgi:phosphoglycerol transferase MdoB-like AlkP superfamily enzyme
MFESTAKPRPAYQSHVLKTFTLALACIVLAIVIWFVDRLALRVQWSTYIFSYGFFANALPVLLLFLILTVLINRVSVAGMLVTLAAGGIYYADHQKFSLLSEPVSFNDIFLIRDMDASTFHLLSNYLNGWYALVVGLIACGLIGVCIRYEPAFFKKSSLVRMMVGLVAIGISASLVVGGKLANDIYGPGKLRVVPWAPLHTILHSGLFSSIEYSNLDYGRALKVPVDRAAIKAFIDMPSGDAANSSDNVASATSSQTHPDIVIIQSESFFDPAILKDVQSSETLLPNLHRALTQATGGTMKAPTFGGGTLRTEFEVLTGIPMDAYPKIEFPYLQINQKSLPSLVGVLHDDGYRAYAVHGNAGGFWNRDKAFKEMGFERFFTRADFPADANTDGWFLSDEAMTDKIIALLDTSSSPTLIFAISIEAHGPYDHSPIRDMAKRNAIAAPATWPAAAVNEYKNYVYHIRNADLQMGRLWAYLASRHRPYVLVFYGDHLPALQNVYAVDGFDDTFDGTTQFVPWFVLASDNAVARTKHIDAWMLGEEVLSAARLAEPPYYRELVKAQKLLGNSHDETQRTKVQRGVDSMSRLYLNGKFDQEIPRLETAEKVQ